MRSWMMNVKGHAKYGANAAKAMNEDDVQRPQVHGPMDIKEMYLSTTTWTTLCDEIGKEHSSTGDELIYVKHAATYLSFL